MKYTIEYTLAKNPQPVTLDMMPAGAVCYVQRDGVGRRAFLEEGDWMTCVVSGKIGDAPSSWTVTSTVGDHPLPAPPSPKTVGELVPGDAWIDKPGDGEESLHMVQHISSIGGVESLVWLTNRFPNKGPNIQSAFIAATNVVSGVRGTYIGRLDPINPDVRFVAEGGES